MAETHEFKRMEEALRALFKEHIEKQDGWVLLFSNTLKKQQEALEKQTQTIEELWQQLNESRKPTYTIMGSASVKYNLLAPNIQNQMIMTGGGNVVTEGY